MRTIRVAVEGAELEVISEGAGKPVMLIQTALQVAAALARFLAAYPLSTPDDPDRPTGDRR